MTTKKPAVYLIAIVALLWSLGAAAKGMYDSIVVEFSGLGQTEVLSFELGAENTINIGSVSGGGGAGKAQFLPLTIERLPDALTNDLFKALVQGQFFETVTIYQGGVAIMLKLVLLESFTLSGEAGKDENAQTEKWTLQYGEIDIKVAD